MRRISVLLIVLLLLPVFLMAQEADEIDEWAEQVYAPYVYMARYPTLQLTEIAEITGIRYFTLAFILGRGDCEARWLGTVPIENSYISTLLLPDLETLRAMGGDVMISFGGAGGDELAKVCNDVDSLVAEYQRVIDVYGVTRLDFDIEGDEMTDEASLARRSEAIAQLQANNPDLHVAFTVPVLPTGLIDTGLGVLESAIENDVEIDVVNIMTMNFGDSFPSDEMGENTIQAAESLHGQLQTLFPEQSEDDVWGMIGLTPMVGINDRQSEIFQLEDAQMVVNFVREQGIPLLTIWSLDRDQACSFVGTLANDCSGIEQETYDFSAILNTVLEDE